MECPKCGFVLDEFTVACPRCSRLGQANNNQHVSNSSNSKPVMPLINKQIIVLSIIVLLVVVVLVSSLFKAGIETDSRPSGTVKINVKDGAAMVWVPGGKFIMGSINGVGDKIEHPAHKVTLSGYWIYKYEVTVAQYRAFCMETSRALPLFPTGYIWTDLSGWDEESLQQHPIVNVTLDDCEAYSDWAGVSLPTEAQWEYAARGPQGNNYPWGGTATPNDPQNGWDQTKCANEYNSNDIDKSTWPVGSFPADISWCGVYDMGGNASELCNDFLDVYASRPVTNPTEHPVLNFGSVKIKMYGVRGGSWACDDINIRSATRAVTMITNGRMKEENDLGFRCISNIR